MNKNRKFQGFNQGLVEVEKNEFFRTNDGSIRRAINAPSHDEGGQIVDAQSVISASYDQVEDGTRKHTKKEGKFAIKPKRQEELMFQNGLEYYKPSKKQISPSEFVERAAIQTGKIIKKYKIDTEKNGVNKYTAATQEANDALIEDLPTIDNLYDIALTDQEKKKNNSVVSSMQYGGIQKTLNGVHEVGKNPVIVPSGDISMKNVDYNIDAYNNETGEYLTQMKPNMDYNFDADEILEVPVAQVGYNRDATIKPKFTKIKGTDSEVTTPNKYGEYTDQFGNIWSKDTNGEFKIVYSNKNSKPISTGNKPTTYSEYLESPDDQYTVRKGDWASSIAPMFNLTVEDIKSMNPDIKDINKIKPGQKLNIRRVPQTLNSNIEDYGNQPVDRMSEINGIEELPEELQVQASNPEIPTLDVKAQNVENTDEIVKVASNIADKFLGKINRDIPMNQYRAMLLANRNVSLPYKPEIPRRTFNYNEIDATNQLNRIAANANQQLQNVNTNTTQGQAVANAIAARKMDVENQVVGEVGNRNQLIRSQVDNANVQAMNQADVMQENANASYVDGVQQVLENQDQRKVQAAGYLDDAIRERNSTDNGISLINLANKNYYIDPKTGEIKRIASKFQGPDSSVKARWGLKKRIC